MTSVILASSGFQNTITFVGADQIILQKWQRDHLNTPSSISIFSQSAKAMPTLFHTQNFKQNQTTMRQNSIPKMNCVLEI